MVRQWMHGKRRKPGEYHLRGILNTLSQFLQCFIWYWAPHVQRRTHGSESNSMTIFQSHGKWLPEWDLEPNPPCTIGCMFHCTTVTPNLWNGNERKQQDSTVEHRREATLRIKLLVIHVQASYSVLVGWEGCHHHSPPHHNSPGATCSGHGAVASSSCCQLFQWKKVPDSCRRRRAWPSQDGPYQSLMMVSVAGPVEGLWWATYAAGLCRGVSWGSVGLLGTREDCSVQCCLLLISTAVHPA